MSDPTESIRREMVNDINPESGTRESLEKQYGKVWNTTELPNDFTVKGFMAPFVVVVRKSDGVKGCLIFQHYPRFYFDFIPEQQ
jgi:hypothetical protein